MTTRATSRATSQHNPKYRQIFDRLARDISSGKYRSDQKLPSEAALVRQFGSSRITVGRAVRELKERGLVQRIAGSGTCEQASTQRCGRAFRPVDPGPRRNRNL